TTTFAPARAKQRAPAAPIPEAAPVMMQTRSVRDIGPLYHGPPAGRDGIVPVRCGGRQRCLPRCPPLGAPPIRRHPRPGGGRSTCGGARRDDRRGFCSSLCRLLIAKGVDRETT